MGKMWCLFQVLGFPAIKYHYRPAVEDKEECLGDRKGRNKEGMARHRMGNGGMSVAADTPGDMPVKDRQAEWFSSKIMSRKVVHYNEIIFLFVLPKVPKVQFLSLTYAHAFERR